MQDIYRKYETEELVALYQSTQREEYLQEIIRRNAGLFHSWAYQYRNIPNYDEDDLTEEMYIACWKAVGGYDPARGVAFTTCLKGYVIQRLNRIYREATRKKRHTGTELASYEELAEINKDGVSGSSFSIECKDFSEIEVREFLESVSGTVKDIAVMLYDGMSKGEIAKNLGVTPATTSYHIKRLQQACIAYFGGVQA